MLPPLLHCPYFLKTFKHLITKAVVRTDEGEVFPRDSPIFPFQRAATILDYSNYNFFRTFVLEELNLFWLCPNPTSTGFRRAAFALLVVVSIAGLLDAYQVPVGLGSVLVREPSIDDVFRLSRCPVLHASLLLRIV